uniref:CRAL-TRIO domain-containing protein n=1 Tax=Odontella aurita TaxID=265563 RepID=A0A7S4J9T0_9STRA|mmetsp:Transcript_42136/g.127835  ORF Transcript_42136/g.127835 Transcript_42136/m.127835 type:complete len:463 (+) Transcript_42136:3-1391(+)
MPAEEAEVRESAKEEEEEEEKVAAPEAEEEPPEDSTADVAAVKEPEEGSPATAEEDAVAAEVSSVRVMPEKLAQPIEVAADDDDDEAVAPAAKEEEIVIAEEELSDVDVGSSTTDDAEETPAKAGDADREGAAEETEEKDSALEKVQENGSHHAAASAVEVDEESRSPPKALKGAKAKPKPAPQASDGKPKPAVVARSGTFHETPAETEALHFMASSLRTELGQAAAGVPPENLLQFLRWSPDVKKAAKRFRAHQKWRMAFMNKERRLLLSEDPDLFRLLATDLLRAPEGCIDKDGAGVLLIRLRECDLVKEYNTVKLVCRAVLYMVERMLERPSNQKLGIRVVLDLNGVAGTNMERGIARILHGACGAFPLRVRGMHVVGPVPWWFGKYPSYVPYKLRERMLYVRDVSELYGVIKKRGLPKDCGGRIAYNPRAWASAQMEREIDDRDFISLERCAPKAIKN